MTFYVFSMTPLTSGYLSFQFNLSLLQTLIYISCVEMSQISTSLTFGASTAIIFAACGAGLLWALFNWHSLYKIDMNGSSEEYRALAQDENKVNQMANIGAKIADGAQQFLKNQYLVCGIFVIIMFVVILLVINISSAICFFIGAITSMLCGAVGMIIATYSNFRTTFTASRSLAQGFKTAYKAGCVMGFALVSISLAVLLVLVLIFKSIYYDQTDSKTRSDTMKIIFEAIAGYGLGGSTVALFGRVGGGIYTKAADVGADLVGKVEKGLAEDSPMNPATIADNVGDNVGDIAGMGADLFGSFAQSTCAALVISSDILAAMDATGSKIDYLMLPLLSSGVGIIACILTSVIAIFVMTVDQESKIQFTLKVQLIVSTILLTGGLAVAFLVLPSQFRLGQETVQSWKAYVSQLAGLYAGMIIGWFTQYMTSHTYFPVRELSESCRSGAATNIIYGLALGYLSTVVPVIAIAVTASASNYLLGYYGVALSALGMLSNLPICLAIDGYGPISDNAGGIAQMCQLGEEVRKRTDALDAAGNTTAAIGKGFAIGSAALVSLALYGGFLHNCNLDKKDQPLSLTDSMVFAGLLIGAMLPYAFSAFTMKSVGKAALGMVAQIRRQINQNPGILTREVQPDYKACIRISTRESLKEMIAPGCLVIFTPLIVGVAFGPKAIAGLLPGSLVSGVQLAISAANTGGAWDNAKKYIQGGNMKNQQEEVVKKGSEIHKAAVVGDTVGDPLKDTSGPSLNILVKLMAILSLVFGSWFSDIHK